MKIWTVLIVLCSSAAYAADPLANTYWRSYDDENGKLKGIVKLTEVNGTLEGRIVENYVNVSVCRQCPPPQTNHPIVGLKIISGLKPSGSAEYADGQIIEPKTGKVYRLKATLKSPNQLELRGFLGISLLGRTQIWERYFPK